MKIRKHYVAYPQDSGVKAKLFTALRDPRPSDVPTLSRALGSIIGFVDGPFATREDAKAQAMRMRPGPFAPNADPLTLTEVAS